MNPALKILSLFAFAAAWAQPFGGLMSNNLRVVQHHAPGNHKRNRRKALKLRNQKRAK